MEELIVRIKNALKQSEVPDKNKTFDLGVYNFNANRQELQYKMQLPVKLTHRESELLFYLCAHKNQLLERSFILKKLWGNDDFFNARSMDVFISNLRKKLKQDPSLRIVNVRGYGYKLICD